MNDTAPALATKPGDDSYREVSSRGPSIRDMAFRDLTFRKFSWAVLILLTLYVCYFSHLGAFGFIGPDEPRYAWIARDMAETGDWVTPRLYGKPWFEKPVFYYWSAALCFKLFGVNETSARLPSAICALLATLALAWLALRVGGWSSARWVLLLLPSTVGMIGFSHAASTDMPFSAALSIAMVCAAVALGVVSSEELFPEDSREGQNLVRRAKKNVYLSLALFGFFLGIAVLAKGPAALILAGGAILLWAASTKHWHEALRLFHPIAIAPFFLTCLPWYGWCAHRNPEFFRVFIIEHNFKRYLTPEFQHIQPFWYYVPITIIALLPWLFWLVWFAVREPSKSESTAERSQILFVTAWGVFPILFFSLSKSKLPGYILPAVLPLGFLLSVAGARALKSRHAFGRFVLGLTGALLFVSPSWIFFSNAHVRGPLVSLYVIVAAVGGLIVTGAAVLRQTRAGLTFCVVLVLFLLNLVYVSISKLDPLLSARSCTGQIGMERAANTYSFKLQRSWQYQLNFYLRREIPEWSPNVAGEAVVVTGAKNLEELEKSAQVIAVVSEQSPQGKVVLVRPRF
ncbi:MAG TPA: glycosyltransferase family 39 protein [Verrucomicrobiae bacterium]|jgi:4-amino-4-deoxy-L-arabinose transferase-like glycosyltransferase|nr:glycosyltransferase family 39 protein [Verrucomicrobiae bacterium]